MHQPQTHRVIGDQAVQCRSSQVNWPAGQPCFACSQGTVCFYCLAASRVTGTSYRGGKQREGAWELVTLCQNARNQARFFYSLGPIVAFLPA